MYQSSAAMDYAAAYKQEEALRHAAHRQLEREVDSHTSAEHRLIAAAVAMLMLLVLVAVI
ncbi:MAG: hypothetical protein ACR2H0_03620 [Candidatus Limnocylindrales bacterium]